MEPLNQSRISDKEIDHCVHLLQKNGIKLVVFDMDLTAVSEHSRGQLLRSNVRDYVSKATPAFLAFVPKLQQHGFYLAIATHSDEAEFDGPIQRDTHILGMELATRLVHDCFPMEVSSAFSIVAYNPRVHPEHDSELNKYKRYHMRVLLAKYGVQGNEVAFFDDTLAVVDDCLNHCGIIHAVQVDDNIGFQIDDVINNFR